jgi:hypothetical protein
MQTLHLLQQTKSINKKVLNYVLNKFMNGMPKMFP